MSGLDEKGLDAAVKAIRDAHWTVRNDIDGSRKRMEFAIRAYLSAVGQKAGTVEVRQLEWVKFAEGLYTASAHPVGIYAVSDGYLAVKLNGVLISEPKDLNDGQAIAQTDYEARIRSALIPSPSVAEAADDPDHRFAVVSSDYLHPFLLGAYSSLDRALKARGGKPDKWHIFERHPAPSPVVPSGLEALRDARLYVVDALDAHEHSDGALAHASDIRTGYTTVDPSEGEQAKPCYPDLVMDAVRRCAEIAQSWEATAKKLAMEHGKNEHRLRHLVAADMASDIASSIADEFGLLPTSET